MDKQINHDKFHEESKTTHRMSKLPDDGDPWAPNNLLTPKEIHQMDPGGPSNRQKALAQPTKMNSFMSGPSKSLTADPPAAAA